MLRLGGIVEQELVIIVLRFFYHFQKFHMSQFFLAYVHELWSVHGHYLVGMQSASLLDNARVV